MSHADADPPQCTLGGGQSALTPSRFAPPAPGGVPRRRVASNLGVSDAAAVYDVSNACLGVLNGMIDVANRIELGQVKAGLVVSCESAREITDIMIERMNHEPSMDAFKTGLATMTGGSGAVAVLLTDGSFTRAGRRRLLGGTRERQGQQGQEGDREETELLHRHAQYPCWAKACSLGPDRIHVLTGVLKSNLRLRDFPALSQAGHRDGRH